MKRHEMFELTIEAEAPKGSHVAIDLTGTFTHERGSRTVKGFYAGNNTYKVRFLPEEVGTYTYEMTGACLDAPRKGSFSVAPADAGRHGIVRADGTHLRHADGTWFHSFGTTVYALAHQSKDLIDETMRSLSKAPFNKVRMCVFPKHYHYNHNEPDHYAFARKPGAQSKDFTVKPDTPSMPASAAATAENDTWDVDHPCFAFWDAFEARVRELDAMGIQVDLILFHPYDRWGFASMPQADNLVYLDYLLRRLCAFPNLWWSLANEYDLCAAKTLADWQGIERFVAENDPYHHLLSNHNCFQPWDFARQNITHVSWQSKMLYRVAEMARRYHKPVLIDECRYEGNVPEFWGNISGREMTARFWRVMAQGGYCTHGETFLPGTEMGGRATDTGETEVVWWARGGKLNGESPERIAFLREIIEGLPGPLDASRDGLGFIIGMSDAEIDEALTDMPPRFRRFISRLTAMEAAERDKFLAMEYSYAGHCGEDAYLWYKDDQCCAAVDITLPEDRAYSVDVIDTWAMTRTRCLTGARGRVRVELPGRPQMAVLAVREGETA